MESHRDRGRLVARRPLITSISPEPTSMSCGPPSFSEIPPLSVQMAREAEDADQAVPGVGPIRRPIPSLQHIPVGATLRLQ